MSEKLVVAKYLNSVSSFLEAAVEIGGQEKDNQTYPFFPTPASTAADH